MNLLDGADQTPDTTNEREAIIQKWKDKPVEDLLNAKAESDLYVKTLERQKDELREMFLQAKEELTAKAKFEDYIDQMRNTQNHQIAPPPANEDSHKYDPKEVETLILQKIQDTERTKTERENFNKVQSKLKEKYGSNYASILKDQQSVLGLADEEINGLAKKSPEAFFRLMGLNETYQDTFQAPPRSGQRNDQFSPKGAPKRDYNYYQELKKTNPMLYLDPKIQVQMDKDSQALGEAFFS